MLNNFTLNNAEAISTDPNPAYLFLEAYFSLNDGDVELAKSNIRRAKYICELYGINCLKILNPEMMNRILKWYDYVDKEIKLKFQEEKKTENTVSEVEGKAQLPIQIYTLGRFSIVKNGEVIKFGRKAPKRAMELLKALISFGGREVMIEKIIDVLWSDYEADAAYNVLGTTVYRLRMILGKQAILQSEGRLTINPEYCWVDIWDVEKKLNTLNKNTNETPDLCVVDDQINQLNNILSLYKGSFLSQNTDSAWVLGMRERLRCKLLSIINVFATKHYRDNNYKSAIELYQRALEIDQANEQMFQGVMRCHLAMKNSTQGLAVYQHCRQMLHKLFSIPPSGETELIRMALEKT